MSSRIGKGIDEFTQALRHNTGIGAHTDAHRRAIFHALQFANGREEVAIHHLSDVFDEIELPQRQQVAETAHPDGNSGVLASSSSSSVVFAVMRENSVHVVLKASLRDVARSIYGALYDSLFVESRIYFRTIARLFNSLATPHVTLALAIFILDGKSGNTPVVDSDVHDAVAQRVIGNGTQFLQFSGLTRAEAMNPDVLSHYLRSQPLRLVALERASGETLHDWLMRQSTMPVSDYSMLFGWRIVLLQLIYTLACFAEVGLSHNDLHAGNVWLEKTSNDDSMQQLTRYAVSPTRAFYTRTPFSMRIYDFDHATKVPTQYDEEELKNQSLDTNDFCGQDGECHRRFNESTLKNEDGTHIYDISTWQDYETERRDKRLNAYYDLYALLANAHQYTQNAPEVRAFIERVIAPSWLSAPFVSTLRFPYHLCMGSRSDILSPCEAPRPWELNLEDPSRPNMWPPHYLLLNDPFFAPNLEPPGIDRMVYDSCYALPSVRVEECGVGAVDENSATTRKRSRK